MGFIALNISTDFLIIPQVEVGAKKCPRGHTLNYNNIICDFCQTRLSKCPQFQEMCPNPTCVDERNRRVKFHGGIATSTSIVFH